MTDPTNKTLRFIRPDVQAMHAYAVQHSVGMVKLDADGLTILPQAKPLTRMIARAFDAYDQTKAQHSAAI